MDVADEFLSDLFTCGVHEECPVSADGELSACYVAWKSVHAVTLAVTVLRSTVDPVAVREHVCSVLADVADGYIGEPGNALAGAAVFVSVTS